VKRKHRRLYFTLVGMAALGVAVALVLAAFRENIVFFFSPTEVIEKGVKPEQRVRLGGLVEEGSVKRAVGTTRVEFRITDMVNAVPVAYSGLLPDLFREGQGVVAEGRFRDGIFQADEVLAKHDENYMPPEVAESLKKSGKWDEMQQKFKATGQMPDHKTK
jgi:cytochrome c-type biogenesis protein CcmE